MSHFFLDANVLSEIWKPKPDASVLRWLDDVEWFLPVPVIAEIQEGGEAAPSPARRTAINGRLDAFLHEHGLLVVEWDAQSSRTWGTLKHSAEVRRQPQALWDSLIDAMAVCCDAVMATRNTADFRHAKTVNP